MENENLKNNQPAEELIEPKTNASSIYYYKVSYNKPLSFEDKKQTENTPQISVVGKNTPPQKTQVVFKPQPPITKSGSTVSVQFNKPAMSEVEKALLERVGKQPLPQNQVYQNGEQTVNSKQPEPNSWENRSRQTLKVEFNKPFKPDVKIKQPVEVESAKASTQQILELTEQQTEPEVKPAMQPTQQAVQQAKPIEQPVQKQSVSQVQKLEPKTIVVNKFSQIVYTPTGRFNRPINTSVESVQEKKVEPLKAVEQTPPQVIVEISEPIVEIIKEPVQTNKPTEPQAETYEINKEVQPAVLTTAEETSNQQKPKSRPKEVASVLFYISLLMVCIYAIVFNVSTVFKIVTNENYIPTFFGYKPIVSAIDSKDLDFEKYDLLLFEEVTTKNINEGKVVAFFENDVLMTHKIKDIFERDGKTYVLTQIENTNSGYTLELSELEGIYSKKIEGVGRVMTFLKSEVGIAVCVVVPIAIYAAVEFWIFLRAKKKEKTHISWPERSN